MQTRHQLTVPYEKFLPQNAHDVTIIDYIPHVEFGSSEFKPLPKKEKRFWMDRKTSFSMLDWTMMCF